MGFSDLLGEGAGAVDGGQRTLADINSSRVAPQVIEKIIYLNAGAAPLRALMQKLKNKKVVRQATFRHFESDVLPTSVEVNDNDGLNDSDTALVVATGHGKRVVVGTLLLCPRTGETMRVTAINTDTLTVVRGYGDSTAASINDDEELKIMGTADTEGNTAPESIHNEPSVVTSVVQTFRQAFSLSRRDLYSEVYGMDEKARCLQDANKAILGQIERTYLFGTGRSTSDATASGSLTGLITTNVSDLAGAELDEQSLNTFLKDVYERNAGEKLTFFAGLNVREALDAFARDNIRYSPDDTLAGVSIGGYQNSFGMCDVIPHGELSDNLGSGASYGRWGGVGFLLNMEFVGRAVYAGESDMVLRQNIETPGTDGKKWEYLSDEGLWLASQKRHGILKGCAALS